jgi:hypothetical protein
MVTHLAYNEERYRTPVDCLNGIRRHLERGWELLQLRGPSPGPFVALFRMQDEEPSEGIHPEETR